MATTTLLTTEAIRVSHVSLALRPSPHKMEMLEFTCGFLQASGRGLTTHPYVVDIDLQRGFLSSLGPMGDQGSVGTGVAGDRQGELRSFS